MLVCIPFSLCYACVFEFHRVVDECPSVSVCICEGVSLWMQMRLYSCEFVCVRGIRANMGVFVYLTVLILATIYLQQQRKRFFF